MKVFKSHQLITEHPPGSRPLVDEIGHLTITEPGGAEHIYQVGEWHGVGRELICAFGPGEEAHDCTRCNPS
jgi:hypothetical protein